MLRPRQLMQICTFFCVFCLTVIFTGDRPAFFFGFFGPPQGLAKKENGRTVIGSPV
jgi:hypothetical protein